MEEKDYKAIAEIIFKNTRISIGDEQEFIRPTVRDDLADYFQKEDSEGRGRLTKDIFVKSRFLKDCGVSEWAFITKY